MGSTPKESWSISFFGTTSKKRSLSNWASPSLTPSAISLQAYVPGSFIYSSTLIGRTQSPPPLKCCGMQESISHNSRAMESLNAVSQKDSSLRVFFGVFRTYSQQKYKMGGFSWML